MIRRLAYLNDETQEKSFAQLNDAGECFHYGAFMAAPGHDWFLKEWLSYYSKKQADVVRDLDWNKARVSLTASGKQAYTRDDVNEIANYLNVKPFELLMHPDDAMAMRRLQDDMIRLAHRNAPIEDGSDLKKVSLS